MLKMKADEEREQKQIPQRLKDQNEVSYCVQMLSPIAIIYLHAEGNPNILIRHQKGSTTSYQNGIFRPPQQLRLNNMI